MQVFADGSGELHPFLDYDVNALSVISNEVDSLLLCQSSNVMEVMGLVHATSDNGDTRLVGYLMGLCKHGSLGHALR